MTDKKRVLLCITAYNGREFFERTLDSAIHIDSAKAKVDTIVLDDCSPEPGFSEDLAQLCADRSIAYYRTPRNLGIPRNVNLGLKTAATQGYDFAIISNSDVIYPANVVDRLIEAYEAGGDRIGSVTALSNNVSIFSLPNGASDTYLADQDVVDSLSQTLAASLGDQVIDVPTGISFCMLVSREAITQVGLMDPIFGRGYCEEVDWSCRSRSLGFRACVAPGVFVYHSGGGSNRAAGIVAEGMTTVPANEAIIDLRYPTFRQEVAAFEATGQMSRIVDQATQAIIKDAGKRLGYEICITSLERPIASERPICVICPTGTPRITAHYLGFAQELPSIGNHNVMTSLTTVFGRTPSVVDIWDRGPNVGRLAELPEARDHYVYPTLADRH